MEIKELGIGQVFVTNNLTACGNYHMFWIVTEATGRKASVSRMGASFEQISKTETITKPIAGIEDGFQLKVSKDSGGLYIGDNKDKKTLQKMYIEPCVFSKTYINVWDASKLKEK